MEGYRLGKLLYHSSSTAVSVYEAISPLGEPVIVKTYEKASPEDANEQVTEALLQMRVEHPNTCRLLDLQLVSLPGRAVRVNLILERLERDLRKDILMRQSEQRPYTDGDLLAIIQQVGSALAYAKTKNIAHRDIKPDNIFIDSSETYKVGDFGCAWQKKENELTTNPVGTMVYLSPELRQAFMSVGKQYNPFKSDVYSLGVTILHASLLRVPDELRTGDNLETTTERVITGLTYSDKVKNLIRKMMIVNDNQRATIEEVITQAEESLESEPRPVMEIPEETVISEETKTPLSPQKSKKRMERPEMKLMMVLRDRCFYSFDVMSDTWKKRIPLRMQVSMSADSVYTLLKGGRIFMCGGGMRPHNKAYIIELSGMVRKLNAMNGSRRSPGVIFLPEVDLVALFGGGFSGHGKCYVGEPFATAENFSMQTGQWTDYPSMHKQRISFTPCLHNSLVYLCGGSATSVETFDPSSRLFTLLPDFTLPETTRYFNSTIVIEDTMIVHGFQGVYKWNLTQRREISSIQHGRLSAWSNCPPTVYEDRVYLLDVNEGFVIVGNVETGERLRQYSLKN